MKAVRYYDRYDVDFVENSGQEYRLPENYRWIRGKWWEKSICSVAHYAVRLASFVYCRLILRIKVVGKEKLKQAGPSGYFVFGNHTQIVADSGCPVNINSPRKVYITVSPANLGIPVLGKMLPWMGAIPIPDDRHRLPEMCAAIEQRCKEGAAIMIYPEAHLWPFCTEIRPFSAVSFKYPVELGAPVFVSTTTYQTRKKGGRPAITVYIDGPFNTGEKPESPGGIRARQRELCEQVRQTMEMRSRENTCEYVKYIKTS